MPIHSYPQYRSSVLVLRALGNERRIRILLLLLRYGTLTVTDIAHFLGISTMAASKHLHVLLRSWPCHEQAQWWISRNTIGQRFHAEGAGNVCAFYNE